MLVELKLKYLTGKQIIRQKSFYIQKHDTWYDLLKAAVHNFFWLNMIQNQYVSLQHKSSHE